MKAIFSMTIVALFSTMLAGCWFYSRPDDTNPDCQKRTYGLAVATTTTENCEPPDANAAPPPPSVAPPLPPPSTP
jgi:hypothetical protein